MYVDREALRPVHDLNMRIAIPGWILLVFKREDPFDVRMRVLSYLLVAVPRFRREASTTIMNNFTGIDAGIPDDDPRTASQIYHELSVRVVLTPPRHETGLQTGEIGIARSWHSWSSGGGSKLSHKPISD